MPSVSIDGATIHYQAAGSGETIVFVGEAGFGPWQWAWQYERVAGPFQAVVVEIPGTGRSETPPYPDDIDTMAAQVEAVLAAVDARRANLVGAGLGGMVCLRHGREYGRAASLTLFDTASNGAQFDEGALRALHPETFADDSVIRDSLEGAFSKEFLANTDIVSQIANWRRREDAVGEALDSQIHALLDFEAGPLYEQDLPVLVGHGLEDPVVPVEAGREMASDLPHGSFVEIEGKHLCFAEHARAVTDRLIDFLDAETDS